MAPSTTLVRVRRLIDAGVFVGFHALTNPSALGVGLEALVAVTLRRHSEKNVRAFRKHAKSLPEVVRLYHLAGASDFIVHVAVRDAEHLRELAMTAFTIREEVDRIHTSLLLEHVAGLHYPIFGQ